MSRYRDNRPLACIINCCEPYRLLQSTRTYRIYTCIVHGYIHVCCLSVKISPSAFSWGMCSCNDGTDHCVYTGQRLSVENPNHSVAIRQRRIIQCRLDRLERQQRKQRKQENHKNQRGTCERLFAATIIDDAFNDYKFWRGVKDYLNYNITIIFPNSDTQSRPVGCTMDGPVVNSIDGPVVESIITRCHVYFHSVLRADRRKHCPVNDTTQMNMCIGRYDELRKILLQNISCDTTARNRLSEELGPNRRKGSTFRHNIGKLVVYDLVGGFDLVPPLVTVTYSNVRSQRRYMKVCDIPR